MSKEQSFEEFAEQVQNMNISEEDKRIIHENLLKIKGEKINLMITGATGVGKSSTINALFGEEVAKVGVSVDPETMTISKYELKNLVIWDTPGLGDSVEKDKVHAQNIIKKLRETDRNGNLLIDLVLVILEGGSRDMGTSRELIRSVIMPNLGPSKENRILVAINQADQAMKGHYWNEEENRPEPKLEAFLEDKVESVKKRIYEDTGVNITPIYYSAGFKEEDLPQIKPYNLSKLLYYIVKYTPLRKRLSIIENINEDTTVWSADDGKDNYKEKTEKSFWETAKEYVVKGTKFLKEWGPIIISTLPKTSKIAKVGKTIIKFLKKF